MSNQPIHRIAVIPGDSIGKEAVPEGLRVLDAVTQRFGVRFEFDHFDRRHRCRHRNRSGQAGTSYP